MFLLSFWLFSIILQACIFFFFWRVDVARHIPAARLARLPMPEALPPVFLMIPCSGRSSGMEAALRSLLEQDYPRLTVYLATHGEEDPARELALRLAALYPQARHVEAAKARLCGQKNRNLLDCLALLDGETGIYVFCDANHSARPDFIRELVRPIVLGKARFCSGYRRSRLLGCDAPTVAFHAINRMLLQLESIPFMAQPWGGAMAADAEAFRELRVAELWSKTVVDDSSLAGLLIGKKERILFCPGAVVESLAGGVNRTRLDAWLFRQLAYPKFYTFVPWLIIGGALAWFAVVGLASVALLLASLSHEVPLPFWGTAAAAGHLAAFMCCQELLRRKIAAGCGPQAWFQGLCLAIRVMYACYWRAIWARELVWRGWRYRLDPQGRVTDITRVAEDKTAASW